MSEEPAAVLVWWTVLLVVLGRSGLTDAADPLEHNSICRFSEKVTTLTINLCCVLKCVMLLSPIDCTQKSEVSHVYNSTYLGQYEWNVGYKGQVGNYHGIEYQGTFDSEPHI